MSVKQQRLRASLSLLVSTGALALPPGQATFAQTTSLFDCQPDGAGGWLCETSAAEPAVSTGGDGRYRSRDRGIVGPATGTGAQPARSTSVAPPGTVSQSGQRSPERVVPAANRGNELDWVPREQLTAAELARVPDNCCGAFIEPPRPAADNGQDPATAPLVFQTETGFTRLPDNSLNLTGPVRIQQGSRTVNNDQTTSVDGTSRSVLMDGNVEFREPGVLMRGSSAYIDSEASSSRLQNAIYVLHDYGAHGAAESIVYSSESNQLTIVNGEFSRCEPETDFWRLSAASIVIDQQAGRGYAKGTSLRVLDVPVFYFPFTLTFPLSDQRVSGFLAPSVGSTRDGGTDLQVPYYFNLAPNYDATLAPRLVSDRGVLLNGEARYLASWSMNTLNVSHLASDQKYREPAGTTPALDRPPQEDRWFLGFEHRGAIGESWTTYIDYNAVSDYAYFEDFGSSGLNVSSRTNLNRQGRLRYNGELFQAGLNVQRTQVLDPFLDPRFAQADLTRPFDRLPQLQFTTDLPIPGGLRFGLDAQYSNFDRNLSEALLSPEQVQAGALVTGSRVNLEPELRWAVEKPGWFFRPALKYRHIGYSLQEQGIYTDDQPSVGVATLSLDSGMIFERPLNLGRGYTQTLEPRLYYLNSDYEDQSTLPLFDTTEFSFSFNQLFRYDRFAGGDRVSNADQLTAAVTSRILDPSGRERARLSLGQVSYFEDRLVTLDNPLQSWVPLYSTTSSSSALVSEFRYAFNESWRLQTDLQWDQDRNEVIEGALQFNFQSSTDLILNVAYRYRSIITLPDFLLSPTIDPRIKQTDVAAALPLNNNWRLLGRWNYDHANARNLETFAGVEYSNCCTTIRVVAREWVRPYQLFLPNIEPDRGIFFQLTLHGLGNIAGGGLSNLLSDSIEGFRDSNQP
ncbi:MAG: LPS-assembly protein LptD [Pseudomonadales bacterium]|nr:LPS-assembly protein LptD [Pseudomonadales bacterium]